MINIYPIINIDEGNDFDDSLVDLCLKNNAAFLQVRMKNASFKHVVDVTKKILEKRDQCGSSTKVIVNDNVEAAIESGADGIHLGQDDNDAQKVKSENPNLIVGLSTHDLEQIEDANSMSIDYIGFGPVFETKTKDTKDKTVLNITKEAAKLSVHPLVFIGGINIDNIDLLPKGDKIYIASVSGLTRLMGAPDV